MIELFGNGWDVAEWWGAWGLREEAASRFLLSLERVSRIAEETSRSCGDDEAASIGVEVIVAGAGVGVGIGAEIDVVTDAHVEGAGAPEECEGPVNACRFDGLNIVSNPDGSCIEL